jgi:GT2 family glycosyltransferase
MILTVIIVSWNTRELLDKCLRSLRAQLDGPKLGLTDVDVFVVDNMSADGSADMVAANHEWVHLIKNCENRGFAAANNQILGNVKSPYVLLLNPDTELFSGALDKLLQFLEDHPKAGIVAPQLLNSDGSVQRSCRKFPTFSGMSYELLGFSRMMPGVSRFREYKMLDWQHDDEREVDQPEGACLLVRKTVLDQIGIFDEGFFMLFEEVDLCYRAKAAGWEIWFTPSARVVHHYGQSIKQVKAKMILSSHRGLYRFWFKHYRNGRWYLDSFAYLSLMILAYLRIIAYWLKSNLVKQVASIA